VLQVLADLLNSKLRGEAIVRALVGSERFWHGFSGLPAGCIASVLRFSDASPVAGCPGPAVGHPAARPQPELEATRPVSATPHDQPRGDGRACGLSERLAAIQQV